MSLSRRLLPSLASLRALEALDRLGSASAVAEELSLTQSAVSRQLQTLERQMGQTLLIRERKRLMLTPEAREFADAMRGALNAIGTAALRLQTRPGGGTLSLAILPTFGMRWLMPRLPDFAARNPDVTINMGTELVPFDFAATGYDAAIHFGTADWPGTDALLLRHEQVVAVASPDLAGVPVTRAADVLKLPLLHIRTRPRAWADWLAFHGQEQSRALPGTLHDQFSTIMQAALHGLGAALMPDYLVEADIAAGRLVPVFGGPVEARGAYYLVWPRTKSGDPSLIRFRDWLSDQAEPEDLLPR